MNNVTDAKLSKRQTDLVEALSTEYKKLFPDMEGKHPFVIAQGLNDLCFLLSCSGDPFIFPKLDDPILARTGNCHVHEAPPKQNSVGVVIL